MVASKAILTPLDIFLASRFLFLDTRSLSLSCSISPWLFHSNRASKMSKKSQKIKSKEEMCNNLVNVYTCAAPNISILNIFGMVITVCFWLSRHNRFIFPLRNIERVSGVVCMWERVYHTHAVYSREREIEWVKENGIIVLRIEIYRMHFRLLLPDRLQSNGFFNVMAISPLLTLIELKLVNLFHVIQQRTLTHTDMGIWSVCNECYGMTLRALVLLFTRQKLQCRPLPTPENSSSSNNNNSNRVWFDTYNANTCRLLGNCRAPVAYIRQLEITATTRD